MKLSYGFAISIVILVGVLIAVLANVFNQVFLLGNILDDIAGALLIAGTLGILDKYLLHNQLTNLVISKVNLKKSIDTTGITEIHLGWKDLPYGKLFAKTKNKVDVVHAYGNTWTNLYADDFVEMLRSRQTKIRVVLLDPDNDVIINAFASQYNKTPNELKTQIRSVLQKWKNIHERSGISDQDRFKIYLQSGIQTMALYRFDNTIICSTLSITKKPKGPYKLPTIVCTNRNQMNDLYSVYLQEIEGIIGEAREIDIASI